MLLVSGEESGGKIKPKTKNQLLLVFVGIVIVAFVLVLTQITKNESECQKNPLVYGAQQIAEQDITPLCTCRLMGQDGRQYNDFYFNEIAITQENPYLVAYSDVRGNIEP